MEQVILRSNEGFADRVEPCAGVEKSVQGDVGQICKRPTHDDGLEGRRRRGRREVSEEGSGHARKLVRAASKSAGRGRRGTRCRIEQERRGQGARQDGGGGLRQSCKSRPARCTATSARSRLTRRVSWCARMRGTSSSPGHTLTVWQKLSSTTKNTVETGA
jgi:hypothetical protein